MSASEAPRFAPATCSKYMETVQGFLMAEETSVRSLADGKKYHLARPKSMNPDPLADDIQERIGIALKVRDAMRKYLRNTTSTERANLRLNDAVADNFELNIMQLSIFLYADIEDLRIRTRSRHQIRTLISAVLSIEPFLGIFLQHHNLKTVLNADMDTSDDERVELSEAARHTALWRDRGKCMLDGTLYPEVAHIWPFTVNNTTTNFHNTHGCFDNLRVFFGHQYAAIQDLFCPLSEITAISDAPWNMICLNRVAHNLWGRALFGLKWICVMGTETLIDAEGRDIVHAMFKVQFFWLPNKLAESLAQYLSPLETQACRRMVRLDGDTREDITGRLERAFAQPFPRFPEEGIRLRQKDGRIIESGFTFELKVDQRDLEKAERCIKLQWLAIRMAALSAAGEAPDDLDRRSPPSLAGFFSVGQAVYTRDNIPPHNSPD